MRIDSLTDFEKVSRISELLTNHATGINASNDEYENLRHDLLHYSNVRNFLPNWLKDHRNLNSFWLFIQPKFGSYSERRLFLIKEFADALNILEFGHNMEIKKQESDENEENEFYAEQHTQYIESQKKKVFIVHGRDNITKEEVSNYIESLNIDVIILHEQASTGKTIIEKIEHYVKDADFAIILYTACDLGRGINEKNIHPKNRARQNVVFEHGYLMAKLGRENVCALVKGDIEKPNDISGVVYVVLDHNKNWQVEINKELKACGFTIPEEEIPF